MAEVTRRRTGEFLRKVFEILISHPEGLPAGEVLTQLRKSIPLTDFETAQVDSGGVRFIKIVRFATVDCVKAGWMVKSHGIWTVTEQGKAAYEQYPDAEAFAKRAFQLYREWRKSSREEPADTGPVPSDISEEKAASITYEEAEEQAWAEIERHLHTMPPYEFQELVASLIRAMGYFVGWVAPPGKDGGVDIIAYSDPLGTKPPRIKIQVKRQESRVNVDGLRSFMAVLAHDDVGIFVNAGGFTKDAEDEARTQQVRRVSLINLERLVELWVEHYAQIEAASKRRLQLQPIYFLAPEA